MSNIWCLVLALPLRYNWTHFIVSSIDRGKYFGLTRAARLSSDASTAGNCCACECVYRWRILPDFSRILGGFIVVLSGALLLYNAMKRVVFRDFWGIFQTTNIKMHRCCIPYTWVYPTDHKSKYRQIWTHTKGVAHNYSEMAFPQICWC